jgi:Secretion system C-terminal sorting domain
VGLGGGGVFLAVCGGGGGAGVGAVCQTIKILPMKKRFSYFFLFCFSLSMMGQTTFNRRLHFDFPAAVLTSIVPTDSCYYATGIIADSIFPYKTGSLFVKFDLQGEPILIKTLTSTQKTYETWFNDLTLLTDGNFAVQGITVDTTVRTILIKFMADGDTIFTKEYLNPAYPNFEFIQPRGGFEPMPGGGFVISNAIKVGSQANVDIYLIKTDSLGNKQWGKVYVNSMWDRPQSLIVTPEGKIIVGGIRTNDNTALENYSYRCHIFQVDSAGNVEWDYLSPNGVGFLRDAANDMVLLDDGSLVVASGVGTEIDWPSVNQVYFDKMVFKLKANLEEEWNVVFKEPKLTGSAYLSNVIRVSDGSGFVIAGKTGEDTPGNNNFALRGWIGKVSPDGDSIWTREYIGVESNNPRHQIIDLKETADGGFIICGESRDLDADSIPQQAWLLKLDEYGCLVPGCYTATEEPAGGEPAISLAIYPNPASDYLNFYLRTPRPVREANFHIVSAGGRLMKTFQSDRPDATYIVPVWDWAAGVYFLQYVEEGVVRASEKFVKQ